MLPLGGPPQRRLAILRISRVDIDLAGIEQQLDDSLMTSIGGPPQRRPAQGVRRLGVGAPVEGGN